MVDHLSRSNEESYTHFTVASTLLFYVLQKTILTETAYISQIFDHTKFQETIQ
jgi:hypothetical protein